MSFEEMNNTKIFGYDDENLIETTISECEAITLIALSAMLHHKSYGDMRSIVLTKGLTLEYGGKLRCGIHPEDNLLWFIIDNEGEDSFLKNLEGILKELKARKET